MPYSPIRVLRRIAVSIAGIVFTAVAVPVIGEFFIRLADEKKWLEHPSARVSVVISYLHTITSSEWFHWFGGGIIGLVIGLYLDLLAKRFDRKAGSSENLSPITMSFDPNNAGGYYWHEDREQDSDFENEEGERRTLKVLRYYIQITNNTDTTISDITAIKAHGHYHEKLIFSFSGTSNCSLHPGASDYALVRTHDPVGAEYTSELFNVDMFRDSFDVMVGAPNTRQIKRKINVDFTKEAAITIQG